VRYPARESHPIYLEPEGLDDGVIYPAGLSTSMPPAIQLDMLRTIPGLECVEMIRPGYAVEYDYLTPGQIQRTLETTSILGLFSAGQINGSSGYEEAAGQGLVAGVNAARSVMGRPAWVPDPRQSYLGVLCEDLTSRAFEEPYRLLPARADARLSLREGNAPLRLGAVARELGLVDADRARRVEALREEIDRAVDALGDAQLRRLRHPDLTLGDALVEIPGFAAMSRNAAREVFLDVRYAPYESQTRRAEQRLADLQGLAIPAALSFATIPGLSGEAVDVLEHRRPTTVAEAKTLPGINVSALAVLTAHLRRRTRMQVP
jgi:tRNA uridine 5-carboxymethylaminomethyl modification enzyme